MGSTRPGKHTHFAIEAMAIEILDLPINSMVIFYRTSGLTY